jgi:hypothetical protein
MQPLQPALHPALPQLRGLGREGEGGAVFESNALPPQKEVPKFAKFANFLNF